MSRSDEDDVKVRNNFLTEILLQRKWYVEDTVERDNVTGQLPAEAIYKLFVTHWVVVGCVCVVGALMIGGLSLCMCYGNERWVHRCPWLFAQNVNNTRDLGEIVTPYLKKETQKTKNKETSKTDDAVPGEDRNAPDLQLTNLIIPNENEGDLASLESFSAVKVDDDSVCDELDAVGAFMMTYGASSKTGKDASSRAVRLF